MMQLEFGAAVTAIANIGVLAGLVFLAFDIRQNTAQMRAEAAYSIHQDVQRLNESIYGDQALSDLHVKADREYDSLDSSERSRVDAYYFSEINLADFVMGLEAEGLSDLVFRTEDWVVRNFRESPGRRAFIDDVYRPAYVDGSYLRSEHLHRLLLEE